MDKICIICREPKEKFNAEHVFPAAMGGSFVIYSVCKECNERLGKNIDSQTSNHKLILHYRKLFKVGRKTKQGVRNIKNPFKGSTLKDDEGHEYFVEYNDIGAQTLMKPTFTEPVVDKDGVFVGKMTMPEKFFKNDEHAIKMFANKTGIDPESIQRIEKEITPQKPANLSIEVTTGPLILGFLKIIYELAVTLIPQYINDPFSVRFAEMLYNGSVSNENKNMLLSDPTVIDEFKNTILSIEGLTAYHHLALFKTIKGKGLFCALKIFPVPYILRISDGENYVKTNSISVVNDSINQIHWANVPLKVSRFKISVGKEKMKRKELRAIKRDEESMFKTVRGNIPVYNNYGKVLYKNLDELARNLPLHNYNFDFASKKCEVPVTYRNGEYYVKSFKNNLLLPITIVDYIFEGVY